MYEFAIVALLGLATLKVVDLFEEIVPALDKFNTLLRLAIGVVIAVALDHSLFSAYGISVRNNWMGTWGTGLIIGSLATAWRAVFGYVGAIAEDGTEARHEHHGPRRMAA
jgi:hypothetical protein